MIDGEALSSKVSLALNFASHFDMFSQSQYLLHTLFFFWFQLHFYLFSFIFNLTFYSKFFFVFQLCFYLS